jgi:ribosomal protein S18 acetylase RimI-like enzyme
MIKNVNNLFRFYRETGSCSSVSFTKTDRFSAISGAKNSWPQLVFDIDFQENTAQELNQVLSLTKELNVKDGVGFYGLFFDGKLVSGLQTFSENQTTGLYFIATDAAFRGRGFATELIRQVMNNSSGIPGSWFCRRFKRLYLCIGDLDFQRKANW